MKNNQNYRIAFIGVTSSGKTCILGRLAQQADADSRYSSTLVNPVINTNSSNAPPDSEEDIAVRGYNKIREAQTAFENNQCPEATPTHETGRLLVTFDMTDEERGEFRVSTEDYSGELINEKLLSSQDSATNELIRKLSLYDGLIFVVETLSPDEDVEKANEYAENVCRIFSAIEGCKGPHKWENTPLAIIFSKWDKFHPDINFSNPEAEEDELERYRKQYPVYENLVKRIRHTTNTQDSLSDLESESSEATTAQRSESELKKIEENTKVFPVSAFGKSIVENGKYRPGKNAQAFGIVAPFAWMVKRLDEMKCAELKKESQSVWNWLCFVKPFCLLWKTVCALKRIPKKTENGKELCRIGNWAWGQLVISVVIDLLFAYLIGWGVAYGIDSYYLNQYQKVVNNQTATQEEVSQAHDIIRAYDDSLLRKNVLHIFRSTSKLDKEIEKITDKRDEVLWGGVISAKTESEKYEAAKRYLEIFPNGKHKEEAINLVTEFENKQKDKGIEELKKLLETNPANCIEQCNVFIEHYQKGVHVEEAKKIKARALDKIQVKEIEEIKAMAKENKPKAKARCESFEGIYKQGPRVDEVKRIREELEKGITLEEDIISYRSLYSGKDDETLTNTLINIIKKYGSTDEGIVALIGEYPDKLKEMLKRKCEGKNDSYIIDERVKAKTRVENLRSLLKGNENLTALIRELDHQIQIQVSKWDKSLYQDIQKRPGFSTIKSYLTNMDGVKKYEGGRMKKEVEAYKKWLEEQDVVKEYTISFKMQWDEKTYNRHCRAKIWVEDISKEKFNKIVDINKDLKETLQLEVKVKKKFADSVYFKAEFKADGNRTLGANGFKWGSGSDSFKVSSLVKGGEIIDLPPNGKLIVTIIDAPPEPQLPPWKE